MFLKSYLPQKQIHIQNVYSFEKKIAAVFMMESVSYNQSLGGPTEEWCHIGGWLIAGLCSTMVIISLRPFSFHSKGVTSTKIYLAK